MKKLLCIVIIIGYTIICSAQTSNSGHLEVLSQTQFAVEGDYSNTNANLLLQIGSATEADVFKTTGTFNAAGILKLDLVNSFLPQYVQNFRLISANSISGNFASVQLPSGYNANITYNTNNITISKFRPEYVLLSGAVRNPLGKLIGTPTLLVNGNANANANAVSSIYSYSYNTITDPVLRLSKNNDIKKANGVSTIDITLIQSHILKKSLLNSPYKLIAADVNNDKKISSIDITYIKRLILGLDTTFTGNRLWAFIDSTYQFPDTTNPFPYKDSISFTNLTTNQTNQSFIGVKLGDVNYDWNPAILGQQSTTNQPLELYYDTVYTNNTNEIKLYLKANHFKELIGMQFGLGFDKTSYDFVGIENNNLGIDYGTTHTEEGQLTFLWNDSKNEAKTLVNGSELFTLVLHKKDNAITNSDLALTGDITSIEAYDKDLQFHTILKGTGAILEKGNPITLIEHENITVSPNPSNGNIIVTIQSKSEKKVQLKLVDVNGKMVMSKTINVSIGKNAIPLSLKAAAGIYYLTIEGLEQKTTKQIQLL